MKNELGQTIGSPDAESTEGNPVDDIALKKILAWYHQQIVIPEKKSRFILCPVGLVGAGKTTVVKPLAEHYGLVRISTDEIRKLLREKGYNFVRTIEIGFMLIQDFAARGFGIAIDADCAGPNIASTIEAWVERIHMKAVWIHVNPPESFIINKLRHFKHTWLFKDADDAIANYHRRKPLHEHLSMPFLYTFDTSLPNLSEQTHQAISRIDAFLAIP